MITILNRFCVAALLLAACCAPAAAQKVPRGITKRDDKNIRAQAAQTVGDYINLLNTVSDPDNSGSDLDEAIANAFNNDNKARLFFNDFEADDDLDLEIDPKEALTKGIQPYLRQFRNFYHQNKALSIRYDVTEISPIYIGENNLYLKVYFNQLMNGKDRKGKGFPAKISKVAEMQIVSAGGQQYYTLISHLDRQSKTDRTSNATAVIISDAGGDAGDADAAAGRHSDIYYRDQLAGGIRMISESNYTDAYFALKEAKQSGATAADADKRIEDLKSKLRALNDEPNDYLYAGLSSKAQTLQDKYRYEQAKQYYVYAKEVKPASAKVAAASILALTQLQTKLQVNTDLLNKGSYTDAAKGFAAALQKDPDNPALHVGLARASAGLGNFNDAEDEFAKATRVDATYPDTYKWRGFYYAGRKDYRAAYDAFTGYQTRTDDSGDKVIIAEIAFCRGKMMQQQSNIPLAIEAYNIAIQNDPGNKEVLVAQADLLRTQGDKGLKAAQKLIDDALRRDDKFADAYFIRARILESQNDKKGAAAAYQSAIQYDKDNPRWYYELGKLQMELNDKTDNAAILTFTSCINIHTSAREDQQLQIQALWKRGKCYYMQNRNDEAESDYNNFMQKAKMLVDGFYVDYANLLIKKAKYDDAMLYLKKAGEKPPVLLSLGILNYMRSPNNEGAYGDYFTRAFRDGVSEEAVKTAPNIQMVYDNSGLVKSLLKKFKYNTDF